MLAGPVAARDRRQVGEELRAAPAPRRRSACCRARRASRSAYCGVCTATGYCTPRCGSSQKFGAVCALERQRDEQVAGDVALGEPDLAGHACGRRRRAARARSRTWAGGRRPRRGSARCGRAICSRDARGSRSSLPRGPDDLHVDRRGEAEVQHLGRDVRREEEEGRARGRPRRAARAACARTRRVGAWCSSSARPGSRRRRARSATPSLSERLMPLFGMPMLSSIVLELGRAG